MTEYVQVLKRVERLQLNSSRVKRSLYRRDRERNGEWFRAKKPFLSFYLTPVRNILEVFGFLDFLSFGSEGSASVTVQEKR